MANDKVSILMYHEVSEVTERNKNIRKMTPLYDISVEQFEEQMSFLHNNRYQTMLIEDMPKFADTGNNAPYIIITFDDGLAGNYKYAVPILQKYNYKAIFFVVTDFIGQSRYMSWQQLNELIDMGMSVQSHTLTHRPLQNLSFNEILKELSMSKKVLEDKLQKEVSVLSAPHGSFNDQVLKAAKQCGYQTICTSEIQRTYLENSSVKPIVLGRIPVTDKFSIQFFKNVIEYKQLTMIKMWTIKSLKNLFKLCIGIENYRRIYRYYFKIKT